MIRFAVLGARRSGINLLGTLLDSHPQIGFFYQIFRLRGEGTPFNQPRSYPAYASASLWRKAGDSLWRGRTVRRFLDEIYAAPGYAAIGFSFMAHHAQEYPTVLPYLQRTEVKLLHVIRRNVLKILASRLTAAARSDASPGRPAAPRRIRLPLADLPEHLAQIQRDGEHWTPLLEQSPCYLRLGYESLLVDREGESRRIMEFLGLPYTELTTPLAKLNPENLERVIENYTEVRERLRGTAFEWCLESGAE